MDRYAETIQFLFGQLPVFHRDGAAAYKPGLDTILAFCRHLGNPQNCFPSLHVAGTNGKGSSSHSLASVLQESGYRTGLYTSPHLKDFRERIRINGIPVAEEEIIRRVDAWKPLIQELKPSFFEITVALAFDCFAAAGVDVAVVEVGMGGRLDSTNIIAPEVCLITNIDFDHQQFLGETLALIAGEKAGIVKPGIPVVIGEGHPATMPVFSRAASANDSQLVHAGDLFAVTDCGTENGLRRVEVRRHEDGTVAEYRLSLLGDYQLKNLPGILAVVSILRRNGWNIPFQALERALSRVQENTGLRGRWQVLDQKPLIICDTGHNPAGMREIVSQLKTYSYRQLWWVLGMVSDKDHGSILELLPRDARYIATQPRLPRALPYGDLCALLQAGGFEASPCQTVEQAVEEAMRKAAPDDLIFIGGSTFVVAEIPFEKFPGGG